MVSANPTGPITVALGAERRATATRSRGCSSSPATRSSASTTTTTPAPRWTASAPRSRRSTQGEEPPEDGYRGDYVDELAALDGDPVPQMLERIEATLERFRIHFDSLGAAERAREPARRSSCRGSTPTRRTAPLWARSSAYGDDDDRVLHPLGRAGLPTYRAADVVYLVDKLDRGFDRAIYVLGADHHGTRNWYAAVARMLGYDPDRVEVLLYQLVHLTRGGETTKMSKRARRRRLARRASSTRSASTPPAGSSSTAAPTRRSRSTSTSPPRRAPRTPSTTCSTRTPGSPGSSATPRPSTPSSETTQPLARRSATSSSVSSSSPRSSPRPRSGARPHAIPTYAIRVADDFHRFYHQHKVLGSEQEAFRLALCTATRDVVARCLDLVGVDRTRPDVAPVTSCWGDACPPVAAPAAQWGRRGSTRHRAACRGGSSHAMRSMAHLPDDFQRASARGGAALLEGRIAVRCDPDAAWTGGWLSEDESEAPLAPTSGRRQRRDDRR